MKTLKLICTTDTIQPSQVLQSESNEKDGKNIPFKSENKRVRCVNCETLFKTNFAMKRHVEKVHVAVQLWY